MKHLLIFLLMTTLLTATAAAESLRRKVQFGWEPVDEAHGYELEFKATKKNEKTYQFKTKKAEWKGILPIGFYEMKVRALDDRGVPGDWSEPSLFEVPLEPVRYVSPGEKKQLKSSSQGKTEVEFRWESVKGAKNYEIEIFSEDEKVKETKKVSALNWSVDLPVAHTYSWKVTAISADGLKSDPVKTQTFDLVGGKIDKPEITKPENEFVREVKWSKPDNAVTYDVALDRYNQKTKKWEPFQASKEVKEPMLPIDPTVPGGSYRVRVSAKGERRQPSDASAISFKIREGDRSPAAEYTHEIRKSIDRLNGFYGIASYLITMVDYKSTSFDGPQGTATSFKALGGTGRLGLGYLSDKSSWGFLGIIDMSGMTNQQQKTVTFAASEVSALWRAAPGELSELRVHMGLAYKEIPIAVTNISTLEVVSYSKASYLAPHLGAEYWYSLTPKLGLQFNAHLYQGLLSVQSANGQAVKPSLSSQFGVLGSYRLTRRITGLMGYARREDKVEYESSGSFSGVTNSASISGDYLNLFLEYGF